MTVKEEKRKVPKLRFPGFTDDWEQRKFKSIFDYLKNNSLSRAELSDEYGSIFNVHYGDVLIKYGEIVNVATEILPKIIDDNIISKYQSSILENGDIVITDAAEDETVGKCSEIRGLQGQKVLAGLHTIPVRPQKKFADGYLGYYLNSSSYHDQLLPLIQGTKVSSISKTGIQDTIISYPKSLVEQEQIGSYFQHLDHLITLHQRKLTHLQLKKKGLLQKMFPRDGERVPELRFPGFTGDWERRKLGEITDSYSGGTPTASKSEYYGGNIPFIRSAEINSDHTELFLTEEGLKSSSAKMVKVGDILYALYGATSGDVGISQLNGAINQAVLDIQPKDGYHSQFIMQWLRHQKQKIVDKYLQGGQGNLSGSIVKDLELLLPSTDEQAKIGECFKNFDRLITLHQRKLELLQLQKKALLQQMFV